jgi:hypothetical protein
MCKKIILLFSLLMAVASVNAQTELSVDTLFDDYERRQGSVLIDLTDDILCGHTRISRYKCLIMKSESDIMRRIEKAVRRDFISRGHYGNGVIIKEIRKNGQLRNASYALGNDGTSPITEYILYSCRDDKITLVYLTGAFTSEKLTGELDKLKNLFIKVNNKQIKLY